MSGEADTRLQALEEVVAALSTKLKIMEEENASLRLQLQNTECKNRKAVKSKSQEKAMSNLKRRFVALKILYLGSRYHGFASQGCHFKTVESELFAALEKTKLLVGTLADAKYSRCGRTDRGVSATAQVVALYMRSRRKDLKDIVLEEASEGDRVSNARSSREEEELYATATEDDNEIDYVSALNRALPSDIRVLGWCPVPPGFHARFSCLYREYKYFFIEDGLNIDVMKEASQKLVGVHDFRNFCKMDAENIHNYVREILAFGIAPTGERWCGQELWAMHVRGNAFLWHQVRCMAAVLFMIGYGHELPSIIDDLLDVDKVTRKPQYLMASELPLVLQTCAFQGLVFRCHAEASRQIQRHLYQHLHQTLLTAALISEGLLQLKCPGSQFSKPSRHVSLLSRPTEPNYSERRTKSNKWSHT